MDFKELGINSVTPVAELQGGINGPRIIVKSVKQGGDTEILSVLPPEYDLRRAIPIPPYILESAIVKHGYMPVTEPPITNSKGYEDYLRRINELKED